MVRKGTGLVVKTCSLGIVSEVTTVCVGEEIVVFDSPSGKDTNERGEVPGGVRHADGDDDDDDD